ncbi:MAG: hypothetical protein IPG50_16595 [Myxococcales bacterium]|nr:hypothetical protein [Myxococcales bacterium]
MIIDKRSTRTVAFALVLGLSSLGIGGCAVSENDVHRWETTEQGPRKLYAVVTHEKFAWPLRVEAALSLIRMKPRHGKNWGIPYLVEGFKDEGGEVKEGAIVALQPDTRKKLLEAMAPELVKQIKTPPPAKNPDGTRPPDPSTPFKDAAFAVLSHDPPLVTDEKVRSELAAAITYWTQADFEARIDYTAQQFGVEQVLRFLGAPAVKALPGMITETSSKIDRLALLIAEIGDPETKLKASAAIVALAQKLDSNEWIEKQKPLVADANKRGGIKTTPEQLAQQVAKYQEQELIRVFGGMKRIGGRPTIDYLLKYASDKNNSEERRKAALAALEGRVDKSNKGDIDKLFALAKDDATPDSVRDLVFGRLGELPKEMVTTRLYELFDSSAKWKVRWVAASLALKTITTKELDTFMSKLPKVPTQKMSLTETVSYGGSIQKLEGPKKARDVIAPYLDSKDMGARLVALGFFYGGKKADIPVVQRHEADTMLIPKCEAADECGWSCDVPKPGTQERESKEIKTVGEFAKFCVIPSMTE